MSIEPCQLCGGSGFILRPLPEAIPPSGVHPEPRAYDPAEGPIPPGYELVPCPECSASGVSAGL